MNQIFLKAILCIIIFSFISGCYDRRPQVIIKGKLGPVDRSVLMIDLSDLAKKLNYWEDSARYSELAQMYPDRVSRIFRNRNYEEGTLGISLSKSDNTFTIVFSDIGSLTDFTPQGKLLAEEMLAAIQNYFPEGSIQKIQKIGY